MKGIKNTFRRLLGVLAAIVMVLGMSVGSAIPAMAAEPSYTITVKGTTTIPIESGHTYEAYQIFTGDVHTEGTGESARTTIQNVTTGSNLSLTANSAGKALADDLKSDETIGKYFNGSAKTGEGATGNYATLANSSTAAEIVQAISDAAMNNNGDEAKALASVLSQHLTGTAASQSTMTQDGSNNNQYVITVSGPGYYLVMDKDGTQTSSTTAGSGTQNKNSLYTGILLEVLREGNIDVTVKGSLPTVKKKVLDGNSWSSAAVKGSSDTINYQITGTLPSGFSSYKTYTHYTFTDTLPKGLDAVMQTGEGNTNKPAVTVLLHEGASSDTSFYEEGGSLKSGYTDITSIFAVSDLTNNADETKTFTVSLNSGVDLKKTQVINSSNVTFTSSSNIILLYNAKLNSNATTGANGNENTVNLEYSNNPNVNHSGDYGKTPDEKATVFTFKLEPVKYHDSVSTSNYLKDATFTLYGVTGSHPNEAKDENNILGMGTSGEDGKVTFYQTKTDENGNTVADTTKPLFLKSGTYILSETVTPAGYNTMQDIAIGLNAEASATNGQVTATITAKLTSHNPGDTASVGFTITGFDNTSTDANYGHPTTGATSSGVITGDLVNMPGSLLPSTGGIGTTIFYVIGGILVAGAVVLLVVRRRRNA